MTRLEQLRDRLPTLYRPDEGDTGLVSRWLKASADVLEQLNRDASDVLQSHWFEYADRALFSPFFHRDRELRELPAPSLSDPELLRFPHIDDLGRLAGLLGLPPLEDPVFLRETAEAYRLRIRRIVALYRNGLGTLDALRSMIEAQLPVEFELPSQPRDRPFWLEEFSPHVVRSVAIPTRGEPAGVVGPLMRWSLANEGLGSIPPTVFIQGVEPEDGVSEATENPILELYEAGGRPIRQGIAYRGTIAAGDTLRIRPAYGSWIGLDNAIQSSVAEPQTDSAADPTAPGPWQTVVGAPTDTVVDFQQTRDRSLWVAANNNAVGQLWIFDGQNWNAVALDGQPRLNCLAEDYPFLLVGTDSGLLRVHLFPEQGSPRTVNSVLAFEGIAVHTIYHAPDGVWWVGAANGAAKLNSLGGQGAPEVLRTELQDIAVFAVDQDGLGTLCFATERGLFQYQSGTDEWFRYVGQERADQEADWQALGTGPLPTDKDFFLPTVRCVYRAADASLWIGTNVGFARYVARATRPGQSLVYETVLEAFPDLASDKVYAIKADARGLIWFCTDRGLFRYDGRDFWQYQTDKWTDLGRADTLIDGTGDPRGAWRYDRNLSEWQRNDRDASVWESYSQPPSSRNEPPVRALTWTDQLVADLGQWDGTNFTPAASVPPADLLVRHKPSEDRIVEGGIPAIPRLPVGKSTWRYLSLEPDAVQPPDVRPWWTVEGRLLPPPPLEKAPGPGRFDIEVPPPSSCFDEAVFAYPPAARVWFAWEPRQPLCVLARLKRRSVDENIDSAILDRVWQGIQQVRPAGGRTILAVEDTIVRGRDNG